MYIYIYIYIYPGIYPSSSTNAHFLTKIDFSNVIYLEKSSYNESGGLEELQALKIHAVIHASSNPWQSPSGAPGGKSLEFKCVEGK